MLRLFRGFTTLSLRLPAPRMIHVSPPMIRELIRVLLDHRWADMIGVRCARPAPRLCDDT